MVADLVPRQKRRIWKPLLVEADDTTANKIGPRNLGLQPDVIVQRHL